MSKSPKAAVPPEVLDFERVKHVVAGTLQSRSDPERVYAARIILSANAFCACPSSSIKGNVCPHLIELLSNVDPVDMKQWILDSISVQPQETE